MASPAFPGVAYPGSTYPSLVTVGTKYFHPPVVDRTPEGVQNDPFWSRLKIPVGISVLKSPGGAYTQVENPSPEQIDAAAVAYLGGHVYPVDFTEAAALTAAGYEVTDE